mgnify:CR=1 FL=1
MENASKALIIAGAILLAILLITLGIYIFQQAQSTVNNSGMSQAEIQSFNSQFTKYEGKIKGSAVKSLVQEVNVNNSQDESQEHQITIVKAIEGSNTSFPTATTSSDKVKQYTTDQVVNTKTYTVKILEYGGNGRITKILIQL